MKTCRKSTFYLLVSLAFLAGALSACTLSAGGTPIADSNAIFTQAAQTLEAQLTQAASGGQSTPTPIDPAQSGTQLAVITPTQPGDSPDPNTPEPGAPCDRGEFVEDVSVPDGETFRPGETFVKTWKIRNNGSCTWTPDYQVVFDSGESMGGPANFQLSGQNIAPGSEIEISVSLTAPEDPGNYRGDWKLRNPAGQVFGLGSQGTAAFWVLIQVGEAPTFNLNFDNIHACDGIPHAILRIKNTGTSTLESAEITLTDLDNGSTLFGPSANSGPFMAKAGECPQGADAVQPGNNAFLGGSLGSSPPGGHRVRATVLICTSDNLGGSCSQETAEFTIP